LVLNVNGAEFAINPVIQIPGEATGVSISPTGRVGVQVKDKSELVAAGQLQLAKFDKPDKLKQVVPAVYKETTASGLPLLFLPEHEGVGTVIQGALNKRY
jgi:flagellar basal-body rod protein FlgG